MSETAAGLQRKIRSAGDLQSVVRTMKALAASNIGQFEKAVRALSDYHRAVEMGLSICFRRSASNALSMERGGRSGGAVGAVVFGSDQGLVGQTVGSRVLLVVPPKDAYGSAGQSQAGIKGTDTLVFVVDIISAVSSGSAS